MAFAVTALLALSILPSEHLHVLSSKRVLVHRHAIAHGSRQDDAVEHVGRSRPGRGHHRGITLEPTFVSTRQHHVDRHPLAVNFVPVVSAPGLVDGVEPMDALAAHGPPIPTDSPRAPPA